MKRFLIMSLMVIFPISYANAQIGITQGATVSQTYITQDTLWTLSGSDVRLNENLGTVSIGTTPSAAFDFYVYSTASQRPLVVIRSDQDGSSGPRLLLDLDSDSEQIGDILGEYIFGESGLFYGKIVGEIDDPTGSSQDGRIKFQVLEDATLRTLMTIEGENSSNIPQITFNPDSRNADFVFTGESGINTALYDASTGYLQHNQYKDFDAIAWFPPTNGGADRDTLNNRWEVYAFDNASAESLFVAWHVPDDARDIDTLRVWASTANTDGDSSSFEIRYLSFGVGEQTNQTLTSSIKDTLDMGTLANAIRELVFPYTSGFTAGETILFSLKRDVSISNNVGADVNLIKMRIDYH